jgi:putative spermidine/putrescine transport system ATP-binding protein
VSATSLASAIGSADMRGAMARAAAGEPRSSVGLRLDDVSKRFGDVVALRPSTLDIPAGELVALLGPSGCGKTTTLRLIAGFELPDTGAILIGGRDVTDLPPNRRRLGMVFQNYSLFPHMTVGENIAFGLKMAKVSKAETETRVRRMLELVRLPGYEARFSHQLSGGQQQRVALARSLVTNPTLLLLDEPLGALDKNLRESMQFELRQLQQKLGITTVLVTHDQEEALTMSDRVVVMSEGRMLQSGSPTEVYERPRTRFVSEFLGTSNLFRCAVLGSDGPSRTRLRLALADNAVDFAVEAAGQEGARDVVVAIRPEKMTLADAASANGAPGLPALVSDHVFRGSYHAYQIRLEGREEPVFVYQQARLTAGRDIFPVGTAVRLEWAPENAVVLADDGA